MRDQVRPGNTDYVYAHTIDTLEFGTRHECITFVGAKKCLNPMDFFPRSARHCKTYMAFTMLGCHKKRQATSVTGSRDRRCEISSSPLKISRLHLCLACRLTRLITANFDPAITRGCQSSPNQQMDLCRTSWSELSREPTDHSPNQPITNARRRLQADRLMAIFDHGSPHEDISCACKHEYESEPCRGVPALQASLQHGLPPAKLRKLLIAGASSHPEANVCACIFHLRYDVPHGGSHDYTREILPAEMTARVAAALARVQKMIGRFSTTFTPRSQSSDYVQFHAYATKFHDTRRAQDAHLGTIDTGQ